MFSISKDAMPEFKYFVIVASPHSVFREKLVMICGGVTIAVGRHSFEPVEVYAAKFVSVTRVVTESLT